MIDALHAGACAYVMKDINTEILKMIIRTVKDGAMWLDPQAVPIYVKELRSCAAASDVKGNV